MRSLEAPAGALPAARRPIVLLVVGHLCRLAMGMLFVVSGVLKIADPEGFTRDMLQYGILSGLPATLFTYVLLPGEIALGVALLLNYRARLGLKAAIGLLFVFITAIGYALATGKPLEDCGCFGQSVPRSPTQTILDDLGFVIVGLVGLYCLRRAADAARWLKPMVLGAVAAGSVIFVVAAPRMPIDNQVTALAPGETWRDLGLTIAEADLGRGAQFVAILGMKDEASETAVKPLNDLAAAGTLVTGIYDDDDEAYNGFFWTHGPSFPLYHVTPAELRRLYRRQPRFFAVKDGIVAMTWPSLPSPEEINASLR